MILGANDSQIFVLDTITIMDERGVEYLMQYDGTSSRYFNDELRASLTIVATESGSTTLLSISADIENHMFQQRKSFASTHAISLKLKRINQLSTFLALYRHKPWWTRPSWGRSLAEIPVQSQALLMQYERTHLFMFAVSDGSLRSEFAGNGDALVISLSSDCAGLTHISSRFCCFGIDENPKVAISSTMEYVRMVLGFDDPDPDLRNTALFTTLGWCTWDAMYQDVSEEGILHKMVELRDKQIKIGWVLIDDGWLSQEQSLLMSYTEDQHKFPNGFASLTRTLRNSFKIEEIGVWHAICGYWGGVSPNASIDKHTLIEARNGVFLPAPDKERAFGFYADWYRSLHQQGITFVKVDGQSAIAHYYEHLLVSNEAAKEVHAGLDAAASLYFSRKLINCMGMSTASICNRTLASLSRNSDDFVPQDERGFAEHAIQNVYNSLYHGALYYLDWDMFWSSHPQALQHLLLRLISGGPMYISDPVGKTDASLLYPLLHDDMTLIRCDGRVQPTDDCIYKNPLEENCILKVENTCQGVQVLCCFNVSSRAHKLTEQYQVPSHSLSMWNVLEKQLETVDEAGALHISLKYDEAALYQDTMRSAVVEVIGVVEKYIPIAAISIIRTTEDATVLQVIDAGTLYFIIRGEAVACCLDGNPIEPVCEDSEKRLYSLAVDCSTVVSIKKIK